MKNLIQSSVRFFSMVSFFILFSLSMMSFRTVEETPKIAFEIESCPTAAFTFQPDGGNSYEINFINLSDNASSYQWSFGDGGTSTSEHPRHVFSAPGTYSVSLIAIKGGCTSEFIGTVDIIEG